MDPNSELPPHMRAEICADKGEETFAYLRDFTLRYTAMSAIMRRRMTYHSKPADLHLRYHSVEELILFNSTAMDADILATPLPVMPKGNCFGNAFRLSLTNPEYRYCEGWATMERGIPTHHAWVMDANGAIHDPTWKNIMLEHKEEGRTRCCYLGVSIPRSQHIGWFLSAGNANILYNGEMVIPGILEKGLNYFEEFDCDGAILDGAADCALELLDRAGLWQLDKNTGIFTHSGTGQRWCGRTNQYV